MKKTVLSAIGFCIGLYDVSVLSWWNYQHEVSADIAYHQLNPTAKTAVDAITGLLYNHADPEVRFLAASIEPDFIKNDTKIINTWHYISLPYVGTPSSKNSVYPTLPNNENIVWATWQSVQNIQNPGSQVERAVYLSLLIHLTEDIHQPLHCIELFSDLFPEGSLGANRFQIAGPSKNLHAFWDQAGSGIGGMYDPLVESIVDIKKTAAEIMRNNPRQQFQAELKGTQSIFGWAEESYAIATKYAFDIPPNTEPSAAYTKTTQTLANARLALAAYRLADILNGVFLRKPLTVVPGLPSQQEVIMHIDAEFPVKPSEKKSGTCT